MEKIRQKRAVFFSLISLFLIILFSIGAEIGKEQKYLESELSATRTRVETLNQAINDLDDKYFSNFVNTAGKSALEAISEYSVKSGRSIYPFEDNFVSVFINGTLNADTQNPIDLKNEPNKYMDDPPIKNLIDEIKKIYSSIGLKIHDLDVEVLNIYQKDPWTIHLIVKFNYFFEDEKEVAAWRGESIEETDISISGMWYHRAIPSVTKPDGNYKIDTTNFVIDTINDSDLCIYDPISSCNISMCDCVKSPSFLSRIEGWTSLRQIDVGNSICHEEEMCNYIYENTIPNVDLSLRNVNIIGWLDHASSYDCQATCTPIYENSKDLMMAIPNLCDTLGECEGYIEECLNTITPLKIQNTNLKYPQFQYRYITTCNYPINFWLAYYLIEDQTPDFIKIKIENAHK